MSVEYSTEIIVGRDILGVDLGDSYDDLENLYELGLDKLTDNGYGAETAEIVGSVIFTLDVPDAIVLSFESINSKIACAKETVRQTDEVIKQDYPDLWEK